MARRSPRPVGRPIPLPRRYGGLGLALLVGVAVRLFFLLQAPRRLNEDEATAGLMGLHILRGEFPVFMYSVAYQGTLESYLTAVVYTLAGASPLTLKVAVFLFSCLFLVITFLVGRRIAGWRAGVLCTVLVAIAPPFLPVYGNYAMLGYMEVAVVGSLVLLLSLDLTTDDRGGTRRTRKLLILGVLAGLGWWINPMILSYLAAAAPFLLLSPTLWASRGLWAVPAAFLLGSLPFWIFNVTHAFWSFALFQTGVGGDLATAPEKLSEPLFQIVGVLGLLARPVPLLSAAAGFVYLALLAVLLVDLGRWRAEPEPEGRLRRRGTLLLLFFSLLHVIAFSLSGYPGVHRYLFPLYSSIPVLTGLALLRLWRWSRPVAAAALLLLLLNNALASVKTAQYFDTADRRDWWQPEPVAEFLQTEGLTRAYAEWEIAPRLTFETRERVVVAKPFDERYPPYLQSVNAARRVAYILLRRDTFKTTQFEPGLQGIGATYQRRDFGVFSVFYDFRPPFEGALVSLRPDGWRAEAQPSKSDPARAFDRDVDTAWFAEEFLTPGTWYRLDLREPVPVGGITLLPVRPGMGTPAGYRIELSPDGRTWDAVAAVPEFAFTLRWTGGQPRADRTGQIVSRFAPRPARYIRITRTGETRDRWWAIAELFVYGPSRAPGPERAEVAARLREGIRLETNGQWGAALAAYGAAVRLDPELEDAHWRTVRAFEKAGLPRDGTDPYRRGVVFERLGMWAKAAREYEMLLGPAAARRGSRSDAWHRLLAIYRRAGGGGDTVQQVERRLREDYIAPVAAEARFGRSVRLLGYGLAPREARAGDTIELAYYWQGLTAMTQDFAIFVHFVKDGKVRFGQDHEPLDGDHPTSQWTAGGLVRETYDVRLPRELPAGDYEIRVGLWNPKTKKRLPLETALPSIGRQLRLTTLRVLPPR